MDEITSFESAYLAVREKEKRFFSINEIKNLPLVSADQLYQQEWKLRNDTFTRFNKYYQRRSYKAVLDLACGNGWFLNRLYNTKSTFVGVEINKAELNQAEILFSDCENVSFYYGNIYEADFNSQFDLITINAAIQYFSPINKIISHLLNLLNPDGELHIMDSQFYNNKSDQKAAKRRSDEYYSHVGSPEMSKFYFHHSYQDLKDFNYRILYQPSTLISKIRRVINQNRSPFPWVVIKKTLAES